ncbi:hypothetical protein BJY52DRAFT_104703 [Lactarius psammicola]|nr:hypothetical protein BJY52DRAFT_104703 [Lactarius psammicola]
MRWHYNAHRVPTQILLFGLVPCRSTPTWSEVCSVSSCGTAEAGCNPRILWSQSPLGYALNRDETVNELVCRSANGWWSCSLDLRVGMHLATCVDHVVGSCKENLQPANQPWIAPGGDLFKDVLSPRSPPRSPGQQSFEVFHTRDADVHREAPYTQRRLAGSSEC